MQASTSAESMCDDANLAPPQQRVQQSKTNKEMIEKPCSSSLHARQKPKGIHLKSVFYFYHYTPMFK